MRIKGIFLTAFILVCLFFSPFFLTNVSAQDDVEDIQAKIEKYEKKLNELRGKESTLQNEIEYMDNQIYLTELRIQSATANIAKTQEKIVKLAGDIESLGTQIDKLEKSIDHQGNVLGSRMRERYKDREESVFMLVFGGDSLNQIISKTEYLKVMEINDNKLIRQMGDTKKSFEEQKKIFTEKKNEAESLKRQLEVEKANLDAYANDLEDQKELKKNLLAQTQNDENKYQGLLEEALRELRQIQGAAGVVIRKGNAVDVEKGEVVGTMGSSGYSTGAHLHFGVYKYSVDDFQDHESWSWYYSNYVNPLDKLESKTVYWGTGCYSDPSGNVKSGKGKWDWPMSSVTITQNYGSKTCYNWMYGGKPHPALDMVGKGDISVMAVEDGEAYFCRNCLGDGGNGVFIFHDGGYMTVYWHLK